MHTTTGSPHSKVRVALLHFGFYFSFGFAIPYFTLYLSRILVLDSGRPANHLVGLFLFVFNGLVLLSSPIAGYISDRFRVGDRVLTFAAIGVALGAAIMSIPGFLGDLSLSATVAIALPGAIIAGFCLHPISPLIDTQTLHYLHHNDGHSTEYGRFRVLGSIGFSISTITIAVILTLSGRIAWTFALFAAGFAGVAIIASTGVRVRAKPVRIPWHHLRTNIRFRRFLLFTFLTSLGVNSAYLFTSYFLDDIGAGFIVMGLTFAASVIPEIPVMFNSGRIIRRLGVANMILLGLAIQVVKLILFVVLASSATTWAIALVSLIHGLGFAMIYAAAVNFVDTLSHPDMRATYQTLYRLLWTVAVAVGGPLSGVLIDLWGTTGLMAGYAGMLCLTGIYFAGWVARPQPSERV